MSKQSVFVPNGNEDKQAIQKAVDACAAQGGGMVCVPAGEWVSGPIHLQSHVTLHLEDKAKIVFSSLPEDYLPPVFTRWEGMECWNYSPLIYARDCEDVAVTGQGTLIGNGADWWDWKERQQAAAEELCYAEKNGIPVDARVYGTREAGLRPSFIQMIGCKGVTLSDFTIVDGPQWTIHPVYCENVRIAGVTVDTHGHNTDGINPDSCRHVVIEDCTLSTGDDCIAINAGMNEDGWRVGRPCEDVLIRRCHMNGGHGAIVIGSAVSGGVQNIHVEDCEARDTMWGIRVKSMRGRGGYVRDVHIQNVALHDIEREGIILSMFYEFSTVQPQNAVPTDIHDITIEHVYGDCAGAPIYVRGLPDSAIRDVHLNDIHVNSPLKPVWTDAEGTVDGHDAL